MSVTAVIPAYNEQSTVGKVVRAARSCPFVREVIVVSDGSTDETPQVARQAGARVIELDANQGKGAAIKAGVEATEAAVVVFLDADLLGLSGDHVRRLVEPVLHGEADMTIGLFGHGRVMTDLALMIAPYLSGQRALRKEVIRGLPHLDVLRYGVEVALTRHIVAANLRVRQVELRGVTHRMKEEKRGFWRGLSARMKMYVDLVREATRL